MTNIKYNTVKHGKLIARLLNVFESSRSYIRSKHYDWNKADRLMSCYVPAESKNAEKKIIFPYTYAIVESMQAYLLSGLLQTPIFEYKDVTGNGLVGVALLERVVNQHCVKNKIGLALNSILRSSLLYSIGVGVCHWTRKYGYKTRSQVTPLFDYLGGLGIESEKTKTQIEQLLFEGNCLSAIDPYCMLPDYNYPLDRIKEGEFFYWEESVSMQSIKARIETDNLINITELENSAKYGSQSYVYDNYGRQQLTDATTPYGDTSTSQVKITKGFHLIIPDDWELGRGTDYELWTFEVANDAVIIRAERLLLDHNEFPIAVCVPTGDGFTKFPVSIIEILSGLQNTLDWLISAHIANVRRAVNNRLIVDPSKVEMGDILKNDNGIIRLKKESWGTSVNDAVKQLNIVDVTSRHINDMNVILQGMDRASGVDFTAMGVVRQGGPERLTAQEFKGSRGGMLTRLDKTARVIGYQLMQDIARLFAYHTQQFMSTDSYVAISGSQQENILTELNSGAGKYEWNGQAGDNGRVKVTPFDLLIDFEVVIKDGSMPDSSNAMLKKSMLETLTSNQELAQSFDSVKIFSSLMKDLGEANVDYYRRANVEVRPDENILDEADKGNVIPISQMLQNAAPRQNVAES